MKFILMRAALLLFATVLSGLPGSLPAKLYDVEYNPNDFVVAQPTCVHRLPLAQASRQWRGKGIRSFAVLNDTALVDKLNRDPESHKNLEAYAYWEDDSIAKGTWRAGNVGDTRAAVTPFLAHEHFGESYKWMLYGDDDTLYYMTGVIKLLSQFDPELPLAITDNVWFMAAHPNPVAPRCLPCGFNLSTINATSANTFIPRPACPFCTRALACGTYGRKYRCNETHLSALEGRFGPSLLQERSDASTAGARQGVGAGGGEDGGKDRFAAALQRAGSSYAAWMAGHMRIKGKYPWEMRNKPALDWEMREPGDPEAEPGGAGSGSGSRSGSDSEFDHVADASYERRRRRRLRRRLRRLLGGESGGSSEGPAGEWLDDPMEDGDEEEQEEEEEAVGGEWLRNFMGDEHDDGSSSGVSLAHKHQRQTLRQLKQKQKQPKPRASRRPKPVAQEYMDGTPWLSAVLGHKVSHGDAEWEALRLPFPFCARHDERLHTRSAPSCLYSISGHGGTGIIFSVGLMRMIDPREAIRFITRQTGCGGGDCLLGRVLWFRMGIGFTDPGTSLQYGSEKYDKFARFIDSNVQMTQLITLADPAAVLLNRRRSTAKAPNCDRSCVWLIENVVGTHVRAAHRQVNATVAEMLKRLRNHATAYEWIMEARRDPEFLAGRMTIARAVRARHGNGRSPQAG